MENTVKKNNPAAGIISVLSLAAGGALLGWSLSMLPEAPAYGFPWAFAGTALSFVLLAAGGWSLNLIVRRRRDGYFRYGQDGSDGAIMLAIFAIVAGVLLLCFNNGALPIVWRRVFISWQMLVITIGAIELARRRFTGGGILIAVGSFFIIRRLEPIYPDIAASGAWSSYWPVLLILLGVAILGGMVFRQRGRCRHHGHWHGCGSGGRMHGRGMARGSGINESCAARTSGVVDVSVGFGSNEQVYLDPVFQGGKISTLFGGVTLDLRRTELPEGETFLKVESLFGGVALYAPEGWDIEIRNESIFGGFADKRFPPSGKKTYDDGRKLVILASNIFGGGEIK